MYAEIVAAIRAEQPFGAAEKIYLSKERYHFPREGTVGDRHPEALLWEMGSHGVVDGLFVAERRSATYPCSECTLIVLSALTEYHRTLYINPRDLSREVGPEVGIPVKHWVNAIVASPCSPESVRGGYCTGLEQTSRRYYFSRQPDGSLCLEACAVSRIL